MSDRRVARLASSVASLFGLLFESILEALSFCFRQLQVDAIS